MRMALGGWRPLPAVLSTSCSVWLTHGLSIAFALESLKREYPSMPRCVRLYQVASCCVPRCRADDPTGKVRALAKRTLEMRQTSQAFDQCEMRTAADCCRKCLCCSALLHLARGFLFARCEMCLCCSGFAHFDDRAIKVLSCGYLRE